MFVSLVTHMLSQTLNQNVGSLLLGHAPNQKTKWPTRPKFERIGRKNAKRPAGRPHLGGMRKLHYQDTDIRVSHRYIIIVYNVIKYSANAVLCELHLSI